MHLLPFEGFICIASAHFRTVLSETAAAGQSAHSHSRHNCSSAQQAEFIAGGQGGMHDAYQRRTVKGRQTAPLQAGPVTRLKGAPSTSSTHSAASANSSRGLVPSASMQSNRSNLRTAQGNWRLARTTLDAAFRCRAAAAVGTACSPDPQLSPDHDPVHAVRVEHDASLHPGAIVVAATVRLGH